MYGIIVYFSLNINVPCVCYLIDFLYIKSGQPFQAKKMYFIWTKKECHQVFCLKTVFNFKKYNAKLWILEYEHALIIMPENLFHVLAVIDVSLFWDVNINVCDSGNFHWNVIFQKAFSLSKLIWHEDHIYIKALQHFAFSVIVLYIICSMHCYSLSR